LLHTRLFIRIIDLAGNGLSEGFILLGQLIDSTKFNGYFVLIRIDGTGSVLWSKKYLLQSVSAAGVFN